MKNSNSDFYFDNDIDMCAFALIQMFGESAPDKARERAEDYDNGKSKDFWVAISNRATEILFEN